MPPCSMLFLLAYYFCSGYPLSNQSLPRKLKGKHVYEQNRLNQIGIVRLNPQLTTGAMVRTITSANFDVPTTIAGFGNALYAVNARFGTPTAPDIEYNIVRVTK